MRYLLTIIIVAVLMALACGLAAIIGSTYDEVMLPLLVGFMSAIFADRLSKGGD